MIHAPLPRNEEARLEALRAYDVLDTPAEEAFDDLTRLAAQICGTPVALVNDLLDISKLEDGSLKLELAVLRVEEVVAQALQQVAPLAAEKKIALLHEIAPGIAECHADEEKLVRTLVNLFGNALKFTPVEGTVTLSVRRSDEEGALLFCVTDTGEGIPEEAFERIFEKFGQVESRTGGRKMSTGLGLTFCKMVMEAHRGRIWVESEPGKGSTFSCALPIPSGNGRE